jgi:hypothetical protein
MFIRMFSSLALLWIWKLHEYRYGFEYEEERKYSMANGKVDKNQ